MSRRKAVLEGSISKQEVDDVSFVRLQPVQSARRDGPNIQSVDVACVHKFTHPLFVIGDCRADQRRADLAQYLVLWTLHDGDEWKHVFCVRHRVVAVADVQDRRTKIVTAFMLD